jgi:hypothetical protein
VGRITVEQPEPSTAAQKNTQAKNLVIDVVVASTGSKSSSNRSEWAPLQKRW